MQPLKTPAKAVTPATSLRTYAIIMVVLTIGYLLVELAFNASLLDIVGQGTSPEGVEHAERYGRCISATAVVLALFGMLLKKRCGNKMTQEGFWIRVVLMIALVFPSVYYGEQELVNFLVEKSAGAQRRNATWMALMGDSLMRGEIDLDGVEFAVGENSKPEDKAFIALLPFWGSSVTDISTRAEKLIPFVSKKAAQAIIGKPDHYYNEAYLKSLAAMKALYNDKYVPGSNAYAKAVNGADKTADDAWAEYVVGLKARGYRPNSVPSYGYNKARRAVKLRGVPIPADWNPADRVTFYRAIVKQVKQQADAKFATYVRWSLGPKATLKPGLSWRQFAKHPDIQRAWKDKIGVPENILLQTNLSYSWFQKTVYGPMVKDLSRKIRGVLNDSEEHYRAGGKNEVWGENSFRRVIVPPIALGFSMIGALVHLSKLLNYFLLLGLPRKRLRLSIVATALMLLMFLPMATSTSITSSRLVTNLTEAAQTSPIHKARAKGLIWIVKTQTLFYPLNKSIQSHVLGGYDFQS